MANNFDLRQFLTENKLTKNAKLLKENSEFFLDAIFDSVNDSFRSGDIDDGVFNTVKGYIDSHQEELLSYQDQNPQDIADDLIAKATSGELNNINEARVEGFDVNKKAFKVSFINKYGGEGDFRILNAETPEQAEEVFTNIFVKNPDYVQSIKSIEPYQVPAPKPQAQPQPGLEDVNYGSIKIDGVDPEDSPEFVDAYVAYAEFEDGTPLSEEELYQLTDELYQSGQLADRAARSLYEGKKRERVEEANAEVSDDVIQKKYNEMFGRNPSTTFADVAKALGVPEDRVGIAVQSSGIKLNETTNKMTQRDKYLTRLVENALGLEGYGEPTQRPTYSEGDEIAQKEPLPKYENIDKLMQEIEIGTSKAMYEYKMKTMKEIADMLEEKATSLEEGEHAEYTDKKAINQMHKDIKKLRDGVAKLRKEFDKKFNKKAKSTAAEKEEKEEAPVTLAEGTFDLRKFLVENKLTASSRMLNENEDGDENEEGDGWKTFDDSGLEGLYMDTVDGVKLYRVTDSSVSDYCAYILEHPNGKTDIVDIEVAGEPKSSEELQEYDILSDKPRIADYIAADIARELS